MKDSEQNLKRLKELELLLGKLRDFVYRHDKNGVFYYLSPSIEEITGYTPEDWKNHYTKYLTNNPINEKVQEYTDKALKTGQPQPPYRVEILHKNGNPVLFEVSEMPYYEDGEVGGIVGIARDITERVKNDKIQNAIYEISQATNRSGNLNKLFEEIHTIIKSLMSAENLYIALVDKETSIISFPYFVDEFDKPPTPRKFGKGLTEFVYSKGEAVVVSKPVEQKLEREGKIELIGADSMSWIGVPLKEKDEVIGVLAVQSYNDGNAYGEDERQILSFVSEQVAQAISKVKKEEQVQKYLEELENTKASLTEKADQLNNLNADKNRFISILSHDLKNPISTLLGYAQFISEEFDYLSKEELIDSVSAVFRTASNIHELLDRILDWVKAQHQSMEVIYKDIELYRVVENNLELYEATAHKKGIKLINGIDQSTIIQADVRILNTILRNLIGNSIKFTENKGFIKVTSLSVENTFEIIIEDTGIGIEPEIVNNLFDGVSSQTRTGTRNEKGTGLGLIICKELIQKLGGSIRAESELGKGSRFLVSLNTSVVNSVNHK